jgi:hypothetical protein
MNKQLDKLTQTTEHMDSRLDSMETASAVLASKFSGLDAHFARIKELDTLASQAVGKAEAAQSKAEAAQAKADAAHGIAWKASLAVAALISTSGAAAHSLYTTLFGN